MEEKKNKNKFFNKKLISLFFVVLLFVFILITSLITLYSTVRTSNLAFGKYSFYIMKSEMQPDIARKGDLVITKKCKYGQIEQGDKIVYGDGVFYYCDKIEQTKETNTYTKMIIIQNDGIKYQLSENEVKGKVVHTIHDLGSIIEFLRTPLGMVFFIVFMICIFLVMRKLFINNEN